MKRVLLIITGAVAWAYGMKAQCAEGEITLTMNIYTDPWAYETYWELVPGTNACGDGTIAWGSNLEAVGCTGGGEQNSYGTETSYPGNTVVNVGPICLTQDEYYTLYFVDDWGDGGLYFELFENGSFSGFYAGSGIGNTWTFQAGNSFLGPHDSPCNAIEIIPGVNAAVEFTNFNCYTQIAEAQPPQGNCLASGVWCPDPATRTAWAKFVVPDEGAYEISTVNNGTIINSQIAVWIADDCYDMSAFTYISGNDDFQGESGVPVCNTDAPECVDRASAAFLNVINTYPECCETGWTAECQSLYDSMNPSCNGEPQTCEYLLEGYDTYGDGWNDCYLILTIDGIETELTITEGNYASWTLPIVSGSDVSIEFVAANWPEEVYVSLKNADGIPLLFVQPVTVDPLLFDSEVSCNGIEWFNPQSSRCYTNCLPAGMTCYIQVDGFDNQTGQVVLSVKPYEAPAAANVIIGDVLCPVGAGADPEGMILPNISGWGLNYFSSWNGPDGFTSDAYFLENVGPGEYTYVAEDLCGNVINETFVVEGPQPFMFTHTATPTCPEANDGTVSFTAAGGTEPYEFVWIYPDTTQHQGVNQNNLSAGTYYLYLIDANGCDIAMPAEVEALPHIEFSLGNDMELCQDFGIMLEGPLAESYAWSSGGIDQNEILTGEDFETGNHEISLSVTNEFGCISSDTLNLIVTECVMVNEMESAQCVIYPNPASNQIFITGALDKFDHVRLYNITGEIVLEKQIINRFQETIDLHALPAGTYLMLLQAEGEIYEHRINVLR